MNIKVNWKAKLSNYTKLTRFDRPVGWFLVLWPALWSLWLAADGMPRMDLVVIFILGAIVMRSAGCVINDIADRNIDAHVARTKDRPIVTGKVSVTEAIGVFIVLCLLAFLLVLATNTLTMMLSLGALVLACCYPFMKRYTHFPQVVLGAAFACSIPMAFAAQTNSLPHKLWLVYVTVLLWTLVYDTFYAMVDRSDDIRIGVKSTAILFGEQDRAITGILQFMVIVGLLMIGQRFELNTLYFASLIVVAGLFVYQQYLIRYRQRGPCFSAFMNNNWVGFVVFLGVLLGTRDISF